MLKIKFIGCIQISATLFFATINLIEVVRPITNGPDAAGAMDESYSDLYLSMNIWMNFGLFGGQFALFTNGINGLFIGTIFYGGLLGKKINQYGKNAMSTYLLITTIIFFTVLAPFVSGGQSAGIDYVGIHEHLFVSLAGFCYIGTNRTKRIKSLRKSMFITLSVPIIYFIFTTIIYFVYNFTIAIYPFLNFANFCSLNLELPISITMTIIAITIITAGFLTTNFLFYEINYHQTTRHHHKYFKKKKHQKGIN